MLIDAIFVLREFCQDSTCRNSTGLTYEIAVAIDVLERARQRLINKEHVRLDNEGAASDDPPDHCWSTTKPPPRPHLTRLDGATRKEEEGSLRLPAVGLRGRARVYGIACGKSGQSEDVET
jgi:hypothetical protein